MSNETELTAAISKAKDAADKGDWAAVKRHLDDAQTSLRGSQLSYRRRAV